MQSYITHKTQIKGFSDISETVKTIEKIAASGVHTLKRRIEVLSEYTKEIEGILGRLSLYYTHQNNPLSQKAQSDKRLLIVITSNKGLVGGLWHDTVNTLSDANNDYYDVVVLGKKGNDYLNNEKDVQVVKSFLSQEDVFVQEEVDSITDYIFNLFKTGEYAFVDILYPKFESLSHQIPTIVKFLPFEFNKSTEIEGATKEHPGLPIFEPSKKGVFISLLEKYISVYFNMIIKETQLSEFAARTINMEHAATKTDELVKKSNLLYTKQRRKTLTNRQLESFVAHKMAKSNKYENTR